MNRCAGTPVSWLALEMYALGELAATEAREIATHLERCGACRACAESIEADGAPALPPLPHTEKAPARRAWPRWQWAVVPALAAVALLLWLGRGRDRSEGALTGRVKGGDVEMTLIRESRGGLADSTRFRAGDRFKVEVSCPPGSRESLDVVVYQDGEAYFPLEPTVIECRNGVALAGAFSLSGGVARICLLRGGAAAPDRDRARREMDAPGPCAEVQPAGGGGSE